MDSSAPMIPIDPSSPKGRLDSFSRSSRPEGCHGRFGIANFPCLTAAGARYRRHVEPPHIPRDRPSSFAVDPLFSPERALALGGSGGGGPVTARLHRQRLEGDHSPEHWVVFLHGILGERQPSS